MRSFVGDTLFMPDFGTARCDFPGGDAKTLFRSIKPDPGTARRLRAFLSAMTTRRSGRGVEFQSTVAEERAKNIHVHDGISEEEFVAMREARDAIAIIDPPTSTTTSPAGPWSAAASSSPQDTAKTMGSLIPQGRALDQGRRGAFEPEGQRGHPRWLPRGEVRPPDRRPGPQARLGRVEGLVETLGRNGVTSNYRYDLAPYTWELVQGLKEGRALFTQPPMPIKCAGAPQKALYLSADHWRRKGVLENIDIQFMNAGGVLFGVKDYVPALMEYIEKYGATLNFFHNLGRHRRPGEKGLVRGDRSPMAADRGRGRVRHDPCLPAADAPDFIRVSPLADAAGWVDVDQNTLRTRPSTTSGRSAT
jgi:sulfide:quinone oxidoreductase